MCELFQSCSSFQNAHQASDYLLWDAYIFQKGVDNFEKELKSCLFLVRGAVPPKEWSVNARFYQQVVMANACVELGW